MFKRGKKLLLLFGLLSIILIACGSNEEVSENNNSENNNGDGESSGDQELHIAWWGTSVHHDLYLEVIELFEEQNPGVTVVPEYSGWNGYWEKLSTQAAGENLPALIQMDYARLNEYVSRDLLKDLGGYAEDGLLQLDDVNELYIESGSVDGTLYSIPLGVNSPVVAYDPAMYEEAGVEPLEPGYTWDEYTEMARKMKENLGEDVYVNVVDGLGDGFFQYIRQQGEWLYNEDQTEIIVDEQKLVDFLKLSEPLREEGVAPTAEMVAQAGTGNEEKLIIDQTSPTDIVTSSQVTFIENLTGRPIELTTLPTMENGEKGSFLKPSVSFSVTSQVSDEEAELAAKFVDFFTTSKEANDILLGIRGTPIFPEMQEYLYPKLDEVTQQVFDYIELVEEEFAGPLYPAPPAGQGEVEAVYDRLMEEYRYGRITAEEVAERFIEEGNAILGGN